MPSRIDKVNALIRNEVAAFFAREHYFPKDVLVTVTSVDTSPDLYYTTVFLSVIPKNRQGTVLEAAKQGIRRIQNHLNGRLTVKYTPQLRFKIDQDEEKDARIEALIAEEKRKAHDNPNA